MTFLIQQITAGIKGDRAIWMVVVLLSFIGLLAVYSTAGALTWQGRASSTTSYFINHFLHVVVALGLVWLAHYIHYRRYQQVSSYLMIISVPLLVLALAMGKSVNDASRWLELPFLSFGFQPSDMAKLALIIYVARELTKKQDYIKSFKDAFMPIIVPVIIVCGLIAPANLSTAAILFFTCLVLMFIGRVHYKYIFLLILLGIVTLALLIAIGRSAPDVVRVDTWISRVNTFLHDENGGYQVEQAKIAIARGGLLGVGPGNSVSRNYLPYSQNDFIFPIICEEYGLLGGLVVLGLYVLLFFRTVVLVTRSPKVFGAFLAIGLSLLITIQALANIAVSVHLVPTTGLTLPFVSKGGTSLVFSAISVGIILSVSRYIEKLDEAVKS